MSVDNITERLRRLIAEINAEESQFAESLSAMQLDEHSLDARHNRAVKKLGCIGEHERLRHVHEALFKVHRKIKRDHERAMQVCQFVAVKLEKGLYTDRELSLEYARLQHMLEMVRREHARLIVERQRIVEEHKAFCSRLNGEFKNL